MANDPKKPVDEKVGAYDKDRPATREGSGGGSGIAITVIVILVALLLILWLFTDII